MLAPRRLALLASLLLWTAACGTSRPTSTTAPSEAAQGVSAQHGMVVSASSYASEIGRGVLQTGGNAVDAAIATGFALAVTHPAAGNIGGGGFMVVRLPDGRSTTFEFREKAPLAAHAEMFLDANGEYSREIHHNSHLAVGVPGTVAGFALAHERMGSLPWSRLVQPAAELAREGFTLSEDLASEFEALIPRFQPYPGSMHAFTKNGEPYQAGETFRQPDLGRTLGRIAEHGRDGFYRGETARWIALEMQKHGGMITLEDLAQYDAHEREPIRGMYNGYEIITMPPPSSGGIALVEMLNILEPYDLAGIGHNSAAYVHVLTEAMRRAYRDRATYVADADFVSVPIGQLTSKEYANDLRLTIDPNTADESHPDDVMAASAATAFESPETTHYSVVDANGMAVSVTYTLEAGYGSKIVVPGAGFLLNNEMGDFNPRPGLTTETGLIGTEPNLARPEQRMLSSMTPTIIARDGHLVAVVGSPGGRTIINTVLQVTLNVAAHGMNIQSAVNAPRFHHQWLPDIISIEQDGITSQTGQRLREMGHELRIGGTQGRSHCIMVDPMTGIIYGAADPRDDDGAARGF